jgi:hypothetical protein
MKIEKQNIYILKSNEEEKIILHVHIKKVYIPGEVRSYFTQG